MGQVILNHSIANSTASTTECWIQHMSLNNRVGYNSEIYTSGKHLHSLGRYLLLFPVFSEEQVHLVNHFRVVVSNECLNLIGQKLRHQYYMKPLKTLLISGPGRLSLRDINFPCIAGILIIFLSQWHYHYHTTRQTAVQSFLHVSCLFVGLVYTF